MSAVWPLAITTVGPVGCGAMLWRHRGALRATVVVKAAFTLVHGGAARLVAGAEVLRRDVPDDAPGARADVARDEPRSSALAAANDLVPRKARVDVTLVGRARGPSGGDPPGATIAVRLGVARDRPIVDRTLQAAVGARLEGLAPMAGPVNPDAPVLDVADDAWARFQSAPADLQIDTLHGDEWIVLDGVHPTLPRLQSRLPFARAVGRLERGESEPSALALRADTLAIRAGGEVVTCAIVWRGDLLVDGGEAGLEELRVSVGVETEGAPIAWPNARTSRREAARSGGRSPAPIGAAAAGTMCLDDTAQDELARRLSTPFGPEAIDQPATAGPATAAALASSTLHIGDDVAALLERQWAAPFASRASAPTSDRESATAPQPVPGAPWAREPAPPVPMLAPDRTRTLAIDRLPGPDAPAVGPSAPASPAPPSPAPPSPARPSSAPPSPAPTPPRVYAAEADSRPEPAAVASSPSRRQARRPPATARRPQAPNLNALLYGQRKKG